MAHGCDPINDGVGSHFDQQSGQHLGKASHQAPGNEHIDHDQVIELAFSSFPRLILAQQTSDLLARRDLFEHRERHQVTQLVQGSHLRYSWLHGELLLASREHFLFVRQIVGSLCSYLSGIGHKRRKRGKN
jgi:hypothetical protein